MGRRSLLLRLRVTGMACGLLVAQRGFAQDKQPVTVRDMVEMTKWGDHHYWMGANWDDTDPWRAAQFWPDGTQFAVVLRKGNISDNTNEFSLLVWATKTMFQSPAPDAVLKMTSSSNRDAIASLSCFRTVKRSLFLVRSRANCDNCIPTISGRAFFENLRILRPTLSLTALAEKQTQLPTLQKSRRERFGMKRQPEVDLWCQTSGPAIWSPDERGSDRRRRGE